MPLLGAAEARLMEQRRGDLGRHHQRVPITHVAVHHLGRGVIPTRSTVVLVLRARQMWGVPERLDRGAQQFNVYACDL